MSEVIDALRISASRLRPVVESLSDAQLEMPAHPTEWTIAHVLSHLGSTAVILRRRFEDAVTGTETSPDLNQPVWDTWNAMSPREQANDALGADQDLIDGLDNLSSEGRAQFRFATGPMSFDFAGFTHLRLSEHLLHCLDVACG